MGAAEEDLRAALFLAHVVDIGADAVAIAVHFARDQFVAADDRLAAAEIDDDVAVFDALDRAVDDLADAADVFVVHALALGIAHFLHDYLLGRLGSDAAEFDRRQRLGDEVAELGGAVAGQGVLERNLVRRLLDGFDHFKQPPQAELAGLGVDFGPHIGLCAVAGLGGLLDGVLHRFDDDHAVDRFLARHGVGDLQKFQSVRANGH